MTTPNLTTRMTTLEARIDTLIALAQGAPSTPVDAPAPKAPKAPKAKAKKAKATPKVKCSIKAHTSKTCDPKARFWSAKGAGEHVAKLDRSNKNWTANADNAPTSQGVCVLPEVGRSDSEHIRGLFEPYHVMHGNVRVTSGYVDPASISDPYLANM